MLAYVNMVITACLLLVSSLVIVLLYHRIKWGFQHRDCKSKVCLVGKTALVTGGMGSK